LQIGRLILGAYHIGAVILLVNMLVAMMSHSFQRVLDKKETEQKFYR